MVLTWELVLIERQRDQDDVAHFRVDNAQVVVDDVDPYDELWPVQFDVVNSGQHDSAIDKVLVRPVLSSSDEEVAIHVRRREFQRVARPDHQWKTTTLVSYTNDLTVRSGERATFVAEFEIQKYPKAPIMVVHPVVGAPSAPTALQYVSVDDLPEE